MRGLRCPLCDVPMREVPRRGVLVDVCPECRGVWLDRGELNKILEGVERWESGDDELERLEPEPYERRREGHPHRKKSMWRELFDFDIFD